MDHKLDDETLMRYLDGDLARDEAREAERLVATSPELRAKADSLAQLRETLQARFAAAEDEADARLDSMWGQLEAQLRAQRPAAGEKPASWWSGVRDWLEAYRSHLLTGGVAAAAGALIAMAVGGGGPTRVVEKVVYVPQPPATVVAAAGTPAEVESLEVEGGSATVLQMEGDADEPITTVIWITPNSDEGPI